jgi:uncharacterized protein (TIGR03437 family)
LPVRDLPVAWWTSGGQQFLWKDSTTDNYGVAYAAAVLGPTPRTYTFPVSVGTSTPQMPPDLTFSVYARPVPALSAVVDAASYQSPVAPGSYVSFFGSGLSDTVRVNRQSILPLSMDAAFASFDVPSAGISVPGRLTYASPGQVNVQVPWELQGHSAAQVKMTVGDSYGNVITVPLADYAPAFFETSSGIAAALDGDYQVVTTANPVARSAVGKDNAVQLFVNGLGPVTNPPATGEPALASPLSETTTWPVVTIGGMQCPVLWSGLAPGFPGLYQVNVGLPAELPAGTLPITLTVGGVTSKASGLPVK